MTKEDSRGEKKEERRDKGMEKYEGCGKRREEKSGRNNRTE